MSPPSALLPETIGCTCLATLPHRRRWASGQLTSGSKYVIVSAAVRQYPISNHSYMKKSVEVAILIGLCLLSLILGLVMGKGAQNIGVALFFYLLAAFFFLAIFRPRIL